MDFTLPVEYQPRTKKFQHPDGGEIDSAEQATKILHLLNEACNMLLDLQVCAKGYNVDSSNEFLTAYKHISDGYRAIYDLDTEFGYNRNTLSRVWKYPQYRIVFEQFDK